VFTAMTLRVSYGVGNLLEVAEELLAVEGHSAVITIFSK
jgi:hypothetical protein